jgi:hypothetical protein
MKQNVGSTERFARLALGAAALAAASRAEGWQRVALAGIGISGISTGLTRYCPINEALGVDRIETVDVGLRDTELRRQIDTNAAMGVPPSQGSTAPDVTREGDLFGERGTI